jgi:hypothetical protein
MYPHHRVLLGVLVCLAFCAISVHGQCACDTPRHRAVLQDLYVATRGPVWLNSSGWLLPSVPVCDWYGLTCVGANITQINLATNNLNGTLTKSLGQLVALQYLYLSYNHLTGILPPEWAAMTAMNKLDLSYNQLTGILPPEWAAMTAMNKLDLSYNQLTGILPPEWAAMTALNHLDLSYNQLTGILPPEWAAMTALNHLDLFVNQLTGILPPEWAAMTALNHLDLSTNQLTGILPPEWAAMTAMGYLELSNNQLTGIVPPEWAAMTAMFYLDLSTNQLTGCCDLCIFPAIAYRLKRGYQPVAVANNSFTGNFNFSCVGASLQMCASLQQDVFVGNKLCGLYCGLPSCSGNSSCTAVLDTAADGPDIAFAEVASQGACCAACTGNPKCAAAEWHGATGVCILKSVTGSTSARPNTTLLLLDERC